MAVKKIQATVTDNGKTKIIDTYTATADEKWGKHERLEGAIRDHKSYVVFSELPPKVKKILMHTKKDTFIQWEEETEDGEIRECEASWTPDWFEVKELQ